MLKRILSGFHRVFKKTYFSQGYTLVELLVVITILSILGLIAYLSFMSYTYYARDGVRVSDIKSMQTALGIFYTEKGFYPVPTLNTVKVSYSGTLVRTQGKFDTQIFTNLNKVNKKPIDPLLGTEYTYSVVHNRQEFEMASAYESDNIAYIPFVSQANADFRYAIVKGTYNGRFIKKDEGTTRYVFGVPSIISTAISDVDIRTIVQNKLFVVDKKGNIPLDYSGKGGQTSGGFDWNISPDDVIIWTGSIDESKTATGTIAIIDKLKKIYTGSLFQTDEDVTPITNLDPFNKPDESIYRMQMMIEGQNLQTIEQKIAQGNVTTSSGVTYDWNIGAFGTCSATCGGGTQTRTITCQRSDGITVADGFCPTVKPPVSQSCNTQSCFTYAYEYGTYGSCSVSTPNLSGWSGCSASCGGGSQTRTCSDASGTQTRTATCKRNDGVTVDNSFCGTPVVSQSCSATCSGYATSQSCNTQSCFTYSWATSGYGSCSASPYYSWSGCSASCGWGTQYGTCYGQWGSQSQSVWCQRSDGATVSDGFCTGSKPSTSQSCYSGCSGSSSQSCYAGSCCAWNMWQPCGPALNRRGCNHRISCDGSCQGTCG